MDLSGPAQLNRYAYVQDDPIDLRDPSGFGPFADFAARVATIVRTAVLILVELPVLLMADLEALGLAGDVGWLAEQFGLNPFYWTRGKVTSGIDWEVTLLVVRSQGFTPAAGAPRWGRWAGCNEPYARLQDMGCTGQVEF